MNISTIAHLIQDSAEQLSISPDIVTSFILVESNGNPWAVRYERNYEWICEVSTMATLLETTYDTALMMQRSSYGLTQIMGAVAWQMGHRGWSTELLNPETNLTYFVKYLSKLIKKQSLTDPLDMYAAWNSGSVKKIDGKYANYRQVANFRRIYEEVTRGAIKWK